MDGGMVDLMVLVFAGFDAQSQTPSHVAAFQRQVGSRRLKWCVVKLGCCAFSKAAFRTCYVLSLGAVPV